jgi:hypothetical protein
VCLFVTFSHLSKYFCIVVRCESLRASLVPLVSSTLLFFGSCETVYGPFGRHTRDLQHVPCSDNVPPGSLWLVIDELG